ncbi:ROK family protein [Candidatus Pacearchaeota archaeon]|nr:ROK family protein [Candidatus Pacearchaeota archaeon]
MVGNKVIAVDLGGTNLRVALVENNKIVKYIKKSTPKEKKQLISEMEDSISQLITKDVKGIGVGSPGPLKDGIIKNPPNIPLRNYNLAAELRKKFKKKVVIKNDVQCVALAEAKFGCKKKNFIVIALGTGIGGGIVIDGKVYTGRNYAGELGHIVLDNGNFLETLWKDTKKMMKKSLGKEILVKDLIKMNSPESDLILEHITCYLGQGLGSIINIFDPEVVIINGGIKEAGEAFLNRIRKEARKYIIFPQETPIIWSKLEHPGTLGASLLISEKLKNE